MFYSIDFLTGNTGLSLCWLASTMGASKSKKLSKKAINNVDIEEQVEFLINPQEPLALRLSSHLLLGILRIYKQQYEFYSGDVQHVITKLMSMHKKPVVNTSNTAKFDLDLTQLNNIDMAFHEKELSWDTDSNLLPNSQINMTMQPMDLDSINMSLSGDEDKMMDMAIEHSSNDMNTGFDMPLEMPQMESGPPIDFSSNNQQMTPMVPMSSINTSVKSVIPRKRSRSRKSSAVSMRKFFDISITSEVIPEHFKWMAFQEQILDIPLISKLQVVHHIEHGRYDDNGMDMQMNNNFDMPSLESQEVGRAASSLSAAGIGIVPALRSDSSKHTTPLKYNNLLSSDIENEFTGPAAMVDSSKVIVDFKL